MLFFFPIYLTNFMLACRNTLISQKHINILRIIQLQNLLCLNSRWVSGAPEPVNSILRPFRERQVVLLHPAGCLHFCPACGHPGKHSSSNQLHLLQETLEHQPCFPVEPGSVRLSLDSNAPFHPLLLLPEAVPQRHRHLLPIQEDLFQHQHIWQHPLPHSHQFRSLCWDGAPYQLSPLVGRG